MSWVEDEIAYRESIKRLIDKHSAVLPYCLVDSFYCGYDKEGKFYYTYDLKYGLPEYIKQELDAVTYLYNYQGEEEIEEMTKEEWMNEDTDFGFGELGVFKANVVTPEASWVDATIELAKDEVADYKDTEQIPIKEEKVNHPNHYRCGDYEVINIIKAALTPEEYKGFLKGNSIKYILRAGKKDNEVQDLEKCNWYLKEQIEVLKRVLE